MSRSWIAWTGTTESGPEVVELEPVDPGPEVAKLEPELDLEPRLELKPRLELMERGPESTEPEPE